MELKTIDGTASPVTPKNVDDIVETLRRRHQDEYDALYLKAGRGVFRAARNTITTIAQFPSGLYSTEEETLRWLADLNVEGVKAYAVFSYMSEEDSCDPNPDVRFEPLGGSDPSVEKFVFLGWYFVCSTVEPRMNLFQFSRNFKALNGLDATRFTEHAINASTFRRTCGRKWLETAK